MRMAKKVLRILAILLILILLMGAIVWVYIDHLAAAALCRGVEVAGKTRCDVGSMNLSVLSGRVSADALAIHNPEGYADGAMLDIGRVSARLAVNSLWRQPIQVADLEISGASLRIQTGPGGSNVGQFIANVRAFTPEVSMIRLRIDRLVIHNVTVRVFANTASQPAVEVPLGEMELTDVYGSDGRGVTFGELSATIVMEILCRSGLSGKISVPSLVSSELVRSFSPVLKSAGAMMELGGSVFPGPVSSILRSISRSATQACSTEPSASSPASQPVGGR